MAADENKRSGAEEFVEAEIELSAPLDPEQEKNLRDALTQISPEAFETCDVGPEKISISYDPTRTNKEDLLRLITSAGGKLKHVASEGSPLLDTQEPIARSGEAERSAGPAEGETA
jgi:hypothetical protein